MQAADGRPPPSPSPVTARPSLRGVLAAATSPPLKSKEAKSTSVAPRSRVPPSPRHRCSNQGEEGTPMQPHSARWACRNHMAAMTKAAEAVRALRDSAQPLLRLRRVNGALRAAPFSILPLCLQSKQLRVIYHFIWLMSPEAMSFFPFLNNDYWWDETLTLLLIAETHLGALFKLWVILVIIFLIQNTVDAAADR